MVSFKDITYSSSDSNVIYVESGEFIVLSHGIATITVENMDCITTIDIKVPHPFIKHIPSVVILGVCSFALLGICINANKKKSKKK